MKKELLKTVLLLMLSITFLNCSNDDNASSDSGENYVEDVQSLMRNITISGAILKDGDIPVPAGIHQDNISSMPNTIIVTSNSLFNIPVNVNTTDGRKPKIVFIKLDGSDQYYQIDLDSNGNPVNTQKSSASMNERISIDCSGHPNIKLNAQPYVETPTYTNPAQVYVYSPPLQSTTPDLTNFMNAQYWTVSRNIEFKVLDVGTGDVQISLTWDTQTDVDLWLTEPNGNKIYYASPNSNTGGELDFDNTVEYGPENIFYHNTAPSGMYKVEVNYYSGRGLTTHYNVVIKNGNNISTYQGTLNATGQTNTVATFNK